MLVYQINELDDKTAHEMFRKCCGSTAWYEAMASRRPFVSLQQMYELSDEIWWSLPAEEWLSAFAKHPQIGDMESLRKKFSTTGAWAAGEQAGCSNADENVLAALAQGNQEYQKKFGYIFIVCATGKSADEMLNILRARLKNEPADELIEAAGEQAKITKLRLEKLCQEVPSQPTC